MNKVQKTSSSLKTFFSILTVLPLISLIMIWFIAAYKHSHVLAILFGFPDEHLIIGENISIPANAIGFLIFLGMVLIQTYLFWQLRKLFAEYASGNIFGHQCSKLLIRIALAFLGLTLASILEISLFSMYLLSKNIIEFRSLLITAGILQGCNICISSTLLVLSWIVEEGRNIKEDNDLTI